MQTTITSRKLGRTITFSRPGKCYIFADLNEREGTLGRQICYGGAVMGSTIGYWGEDEEQFKAICRTWYKQYIRGYQA